jgi:hypothetical protein
MLEAGGVAMSSFLHYAIGSDVGIEIESERTTRRELKLN